MSPNRFHASVIAALALGTAAFAQTTVTINLQVAGKARSGVVHIPSGTSNPPVVFFVHGYGGSGAGFENDTKGDKVADREKFIAIYPSAVSGSWNMQDTSDYPFLLALLDTVNGRYKIDRNRVYCAGFSQGGFISFGVGYKHPEVFAAVAPVSGHIPSFSTAAPLKRAVPMFLTFGTNDVSDVASFMADLNTWMRLDTCSASSKKSQRPYPATRARSVVARSTWSCAHGTEVIIDSVVGGGHEWSMDTASHVNTTEEVWAFFKKYTLAGPASIDSRVPERMIAPVSASFHEGTVRMSGADDARLVRISNLDGSVVAVVPVEAGSFEFRNRAPGLYLCTILGSEQVRAFKLSVP